MSRFSKYLAGQLVGPVLIMTLMLGGMAWITQAVRLLELVAGQTDSTLTYFGLSMLTLPRMLSYTLPISLFGGMLFAMHRLMQESELVVMSATGSSRWQLATPALVLAGVFSVIIMLLNIWISPMALQELRKQRVFIENDLAGTIIRKGAFSSPNNNVTIYARDQREDGVYLGLMLHDTSKDGQTSTYIAREGVLVRNNDMDNNKPHFLLIDGTVLQGMNRERSDILEFTEYVYDLSAFIKTPGPIVFESEERYLPDLFFPDTRRGYDKFFEGRLIATGHERVADMLHPFVLAMICVVTILTGTLNRQGQQIRLISGVAVAVVYRILVFATMGLAANNNDFIFMIYLLPLSVLIIACLFLQFSAQGENLLTKLNPVPLLDSIRQNLNNRGVS